MKRSLIIIFLFFVCFGGVFAENNVCVKPEGILEENNNKDTLRNYISLILRDGLSQRIDWELESEEIIEYYLDCFAKDKEEYIEYQDYLLFYNFRKMLKTHSNCGIFFLSDFSSAVEIGEKTVKNLEKYGKDNENYEYYLGRYSFLLGIAYYNQKEYKKALEYLKVGFDKQNIKFKYPKNFSVLLQDGNYAETVDIKIGNKIIHSTFFNHYLTNKYKDYGEWNYYGGGINTRMSILN